MMIGVFLRRRKGYLSCSQAMRKQQRWHRLGLICLAALEATELSWHGMTQRLNGYEREGNGGIEKSVNRRTSKALSFIELNRRLSMVRSGAFT